MLIIFNICCVIIILTSINAWCSGKDAVLKHTTPYAFLPLLYSVVTEVLGIAPNDFAQFVVGGSTVSLVSLVMFYRHGRNRLHIDILTVLIVQNILNLVILFVAITGSMWLNTYNTVTFLSYVAVTLIIIRNTDGLVINTRNAILLIYGFCNGLLHNSSLSKSNPMAQK